LLQKHGENVIDDVAEEDEECEQIFLKIAGINAAGLKEKEAAEVIAFKHPDLTEITPDPFAWLKITILGEAPYEFHPQTFVDPKVLANFQLAV